MKSWANGLERGAKTAQGELEAEPEDAAAAPLRIPEFVQYGTGRGSRVDLTIEFPGGRVRVTGVRAKDVVSYRKIKQAAMEQGAVLPFFPNGDEVWTAVLTAGRAHARKEALLEGEEIFEAIAEGICKMLEDSERGRDAGDFRAGKGIEVVLDERPHLLVCPSVLVRRLRRVRVDDRPPRATIEEAAARLLAKRTARPWLGEVRPKLGRFRSRCRRGSLGGVDVARRARTGRRP
jgi:hypothetical protein